MIQYPTKLPRRRLAALLVLILSMIILYGLAGSSPAYAAEVLTLEEVVERIHTDNTDLLILEEQITYATFAQTEAYRKVPDLMNRVQGASGEQRLSLARQAQIEPLRATFNTAGLKRQKERLLVTLRSDAEAAYIGILEDQEALVLAKYNVFVAKKDEAVKKALFDAGKLARIDYDRAIVKRTETEQQIKTLERSIQLGYMKLNALMERPSADRYELTKTDFAFTLPEVKDLPSAIERYKVKAESIIKQDEAVVLASTELGIVRAYGITSTIGGVSVVETLAEKERNFNIETLRLRIAKRSADYDFRIAWNNLQSSYDSFVIAHGRYILSSKELEIARVRYERGLTTAPVYLQSAAGHEAARLSRQKALKEFNLTRSAFVVDYAIEEVE